MHSRTRRFKNDRRDQTILRLEKALEEIWESVGIGLGFLNGDKRLFTPNDSMKIVPSGMREKKTTRVLSGHTRA